jgi:hypothetical protein
LSRSDRRRNAHPTGVAGDIGKTGIRREQLFALVILCSFRQQFYLLYAANDLHSIPLTDEEFALIAD